jgi:uncharacterized cupin superfamily protein
MPRPPDPFDPARASVRTELFGGQGSVKVWDLGGAKPPFTAILFCELDPGGTVGEHVQRTDHEVVIVLSGEAVLYVNAVPHACVPGAAVPLRLGERLSIDNASPTAPLRYLIVKART